MREPKWLIVAAVMLLAPVLVFAAVYRFSHTTTGAPFPPPQFVLADTTAELPTTNVREGDMAYSKDDDKVWKRTAAAWVEVGGGSGAPTDAEYLVGALHAGLSAERVPTGTATVTWDFGTVGQAKANVPDDAITYAKLQNVSATSRFLGRITAAAGDAEELTGTQATTLLDVFTSGLKGLAPASGGGTANFLRADGSWQVPPGGSGAPTDAIYYVGALHAGLSAELVLGTSANTIEGLCVGFAACTPVADEIRLGDANFKLDFALGGAGVPGIAFNSTTGRIQYNRSSAFMEFYVSGGSVATLTTAGLDLTTPLAYTEGGTGTGSVNFDAVLVGNASGWVQRTLPDCDDIDGQHLNYDTATDTFSCGTSSSGGGGGGGVTKWMSSSTTSTSTTFADISAELSFAVVASTTYLFTCELAYDAGVTTTAVHLSMNGPSAALLQYTVQVATSATDHHFASQTAFDTVTDPGSSAGSLDLPARITGTIQVGGSDGTLAPRFKTEVSSSAVTIKQGSFCIVTEVI